MIPDKKKQLRGDVLIIDDDASICEILKGYCEKMGCFRNILIAHDGSMASSKLRNQKFALILLDLKMPKKSGLDLLRELDDKSLNSKKSIVVISGTFDKTAVEKIIATGIKSFLPKPFTEADFQEKILKLLTIK
ncbi:MAG: response regulator [Bacteriovorax sp.]|nr:response regulator [Bacteriovorax sp.]